MDLPKKFVSQVSHSYKMKCAIISVLFVFLNFASSMESKSAQLRQLSGKVQNKEMTIKNPENSILIYIKRLEIVGNGVLITCEHFVTAGHMEEYFDKNTLPLTAIVGAKGLTWYPITILDIEPHEDYLKGNLNADIGVGILKEPVTHDIKIPPDFSHLSKDPVPPQSILLLLGWKHYENSVIVASKYFKSNFLDPESWVFYADCIKSGNSEWRGSPVLNRDNMVVGIASSKSREGNIMLVQIYHYLETFIIPETKKERVKKISPERVDSGSEEDDDAYYSPNKSEESGPSDCLLNKKGK